jgi:hypothetical protein
VILPEISKEQAIMATELREDFYTYHKETSSISGKFSYTAS